MEMVTPFQYIHERGVRSIYNAVSTFTFTSGGHLSGS